jgi:hypothetical protein
MEQIVYQYEEIRTTKTGDDLTAGFRLKKWTGKNWSVLLKTYKTNLKLFKDK